MADDAAPRDPALDIDPKPLFRADVDQSGDWYVWRRVGVSGWATMRRCDSEQEAKDVAKAMNEDPDASIF